MANLSLKLGKVVRRLRGQKGISQEGLAALVGIDRTFLGEIERGEANPSVEVAQRIASGLAVNLSELILMAEHENE